MLLLYTLDNERKVEIGLIFAEISSSLQVIAPHGKSRSISCQVAKKGCLRGSWYLPRRNLLSMRKTMCSEGRYSTRQVYLQYCLFALEWSLFFQGFSILVK
jgi:hypothetical protein